MSRSDRLGTPTNDGWIGSPRYDLCFFSGSLLVPGVLWVAFHAGALTGVAVYVIFQLLFNMPHNFQTWTLTVMDKGDRAAHGRRYAVAAAVLLAVFGGTLLTSPQVAYPWLPGAGLVPQPQPRRRA